MQRLWIVMLALLVTAPAVSGAPGQRAPDVALVNMTGTLKRLDSHTVTIADQEKHVLEFHRTRKTHFYRGKKRISPSHFQIGDAVSVESVQLVDGSLEAVNVYLEEKP